MSSDRNPALGELTTVGTREAVIHRGVDVRRLDDLRPDAVHEIDGFEFRTLPERGELLSTFATVNDVHFGEVECGRVEGHDGPEVGPVLSVGPGEPPYPETMSRAAVAEMLEVDPVAVVVKGDITAGGTDAEIDAFLDVYAPFGDRLHWVRGNHESYHHVQRGAVPFQQVDLPGVRLVVIDTSLDGRTQGGVSAEQLDRLDAAAADSDRPVVVLGHHHAWNPLSPERAPDYFGVNPDDSEGLIEVVARRPRIVAYLAGHTHRNRVRRFPTTGSVPWGEVSSVKDYPGAWAEYRVHEGGIVQVLHRVSSPEALAWTERTRAMFFGLYADYAFGRLADRCHLIETHRAA